MQEQTTATERYNFFNTLTCLVKALEHRCTIIDLRNESCVSGLIKHVDGHMNVEMENVTFFDPRGRRHRFKEFYVSSRNIRYVHIPTELSMVELMENQLGTLGKRYDKPSIPVNRKYRKAMKYNEEIVKHAYSDDPGTSKS